MQIEEQPGKISIYNPGKVDAVHFAQGVRRLKAAFPKLQKSWFDLLDEMLDEVNFSNQKFKDAVMHLIKTCPYPEPTLASLLNYDKTVKSFTYEEVLEHNNRFPNTMRNFKEIEKGKWIRCEDEKLFSP